VPAPFLKKRQKTPGYLPGVFLRVWKNKHFAKGYNYKSFEFLKNFLYIKTLSDNVYEEAE